MSHLSNLYNDTSYYSFKYNENYKYSKIISQLLFRFNILHHFTSFFIKKYRTGLSDV